MTRHVSQTLQHRMLPQLSRRVVVLGALSATALPSLLAHATEGEERTVFFLEAYKKLVGDTEPPLGTLTLEMPDLAENGNMVPFTITATPSASAEGQSPAASVKTITLFSTGNPQPLVGVFSFSALSGRTTVSGRMRLARTQDIIAIAELTTGEFVRGQTNVKVTVGGCGG
jgi:sulfur-oxidizing protein SoxY